MDTLTAQKLEYILSGYKVTMQDRDAIIDLVDEYAGAVANKNIVLSDVIGSMPISKDDSMDDAQDRIDRGEDGWG